MYFHDVIYLMTKITSYDTKKLVQDQVNNQLFDYFKGIKEKYEDEINKTKASSLEKMNKMTRLFQEGYKGEGYDWNEKNYENYIKECLGCTVQPFVTVSELTNYYQNFDIGIWPLQESTSQLDAAACGMPIIINEKVQDDFRSKGNGLQYKDCDYIDLASKILSLKSTELRNKMGIIGNKKITEFYSWNYLAKMKIVDFNKKY